MQLLEKEKRLSDSILWQLQYNAYTQFGPKAWSQKGVPFYVTSNPYTANSYAQVVYGYLKDNSLNINEPLYLLDLGAGTGRFAYLFLKEFSQLIKNSPLEELSFRYVMTDIVSENFSFWLDHPLLKEYIDQGILDYCYYHHSQTEDAIHLEISKNTISGDGKNPLVLIANYFFDTIPQDLFRVKDGSLEEGYISLYTSEKYADNQDPEIINDLTWEYTFVPVDHIDSLYKDTPNYRELLLLYQQNVQNATFLFPIGALQTLDYFKKLSNNNMLLLAGDQGVVTIEQIQEWAPKLSLHGSFSIAVSYHTLASYFEENYGQYFLSTMPDPAFVIIAGVLSPSKNLLYETEYAFKNFIDAFEPQDYWRFGGELEKCPISLEAILLLVKLGRFDPMNVYGFYNNIRKELPFASHDLKERLSHLLHQVAKNFFPVAPEDGAFLANIGVLFFEMKKYRQALDYFRQAQVYEGSKEYLLSNINACLSKLNLTA